MSALLSALRKHTHTHTPCKNRSTHLPQHAAGTPSDTLGAVNVENQGAQGSNKAWRLDRVKAVEVDGDTVCAGQWVCGWRVDGGWVEQLGE